MTDDLASLAQIALAVAREAGALALSGYRRPHHVEEKGQADLVTEFDLSAERLIRERLAQLTPSIPLIAEEEGGTKSGELIWYADPIDGTTNYAHGHPFWAVSIGLLEAGQPVVGAVVAPALCNEWVAHHGGPALRDGAPCRVSTTEDLSRALVATGFPRDRRREPDNNFASFIHVKKNVQGVRRCGAAALDLCLVADGTYDAYWERQLSTWDVAGGAAIAVAAGGRLSHLDGGPARLDSGHILLTNGPLHVGMLELLRAASEG